MLGQGIIFCFRRILFLFSQFLYAKISRNMSRHRRHLDIWDENPSTGYFEEKTWVKWFSPLRRVTQIETPWHLIRLHVERQTKASSWSL